VRYALRTYNFLFTNSTKTDILKIMKIISWNVNGIRAAYNKGFLHWFKKVDADIVCLQEIKAQQKQIPEDLIELKNYFAYFNFALKKGYSGTAIFSRKKPTAIKNKLGLKRFDDEGRVLELKYPDFTLMNLYLPHGGRQKENLNYKIDAYNHLLSYFKKLKNQKAILIGDFNVAHTELDLAMPKQNQDNIMFTPTERKQIDRIINLGFIDTFRKFHQTKRQYTWWLYMYNARQRNLGWRIDYVFASRSLTPKLKNAFILDKTTGSDHCPVGIEIL